MNNEWISIQSRLPDSSRFVLVHCEFGVHVDLYEGNGKFENEPLVTHWMELPPNPIGK